MDKRCDYELNKDILFLRVRDRSGNPGTARGLSFLWAGEGRPRADKWGAVRSWSVEPGLAKLFFRFH